MTASTPQRAGRREWIGLAVLALPAMLISMDMTVLYLAVPALSEDLQPTSSQLLWITDAYGFLIAGFLVIMGTLGDRIGRRRLLLIGAAAFGAVSVAAAFSTSAEMLIVLRALLGVAGATLMPSTLSLIRNMFHDDAQRTTAIGVWITSFSVGGAIGPLVGGVLLDRFWWGSVFLMAVPVMGLLLVAGPRLLPEYRDPSPGRFDLVSAALSLVAVLTMVYGVKHAAEDGLGATPAIAVAIGLVVGAVFLQRQRRLLDPLIDVGLFRVRAFSASLTMNVLAIFVMMGAFLFVAQYLQLVLGMSPLKAGLWLLPETVAFVVGGLLTQRLTRLARPGVVAAAGGLLAASGFLVFTQVGDYGLTAIVAGSVLSALGLAPIFTLGTDLIVGSAPPERAGAASAVSETGNELGGALGIAIIGSIGTAAYRADLAGDAPAGVPAAEAEAARDTLGGAVAATDGLPDAVAVPLLEWARAAFEQALVVATAFSALVMVGAAIIALLVFRERREDEQPVEAQARLEPSCDAA